MKDLTLAEKIALRSYLNHLRYIEINSNTENIGWLITTDERRIFAKFLARLEYEINNDAKHTQAIKDWLGE